MEVWWELGDYGDELRVGGWGGEWGDDMVSWVSW